VSIFFRPRVPSPPHTHMPLASTVRPSVQRRPVQQLAYPGGYASNSGSRIRTDGDSVVVRDMGNEVVVGYGSGAQDASASRLSAGYPSQAYPNDVVVVDPSASRVSTTYASQLRNDVGYGDASASRLSSAYAGPQSPIIVQPDGSIVVDEPASYVVARTEPYPNDELRPSVSRYVRDSTAYEGSPASRLSRSRVERIVSMPFPNAPARRTEDAYMRPDERDDIIVELRASVSRLEKRVGGLETERTNLLSTVARFKEDNAALQREIARLNKLLDEERAMMQVNLSSEEMKRREAFELVDLQRKLLLMKDEEIRQLSQLAAAHKEQIFVLYSHLGSVEINSILDDAFDVRRIDLATLDPDTRARIMELLRAPTMEGRFDVAVVRPVKRGGGGGGGRGGAVYAGGRGDAAALDAADGVIDGRYQGREILVPKKHPMGAKSSGYGRNPVYARDKSAAAQMDAADGVIDGRFEGHDILVPKNQALGPSRGAPVYASDRQAASALDAADGVVDGRYAGHEILVPKGRR